MVVGGLAALVALAVAAFLPAREKATARPPDTGLDGR
jgi:hypothetical protein